MRAHPGRSRTGGKGRRAAGGSDRPVRAGLGGLGWAWPLLGAAGSVAMTVAGPGLVDRPGITWWFALRVPGAHAGSMALFYLGVASVVAAWLGVGSRLRRLPAARPVHVLAAAALWASPLLAGPALFSGDSYSYLAQGMLLHLGLSPYHDAPVVLARLGRARLLDAVSPFWRRTTAPYGPLFLGIVSLVDGAVGSARLVLGVVLQRGVELGGCALLAAFVPRLARVLGGDAARATWLAVASPLVLFDLLAAGHNDALMAGLMVAGVALALEGRPLPGLVLCAAAATVKAPAAVAVAFIALSWLRAQHGGAARARVLAASVAATLGVLVAVSLGTGTGLSWLTPAVLADPGKVHLAVTPSTALGYSVGHALHALGAGWHVAALESAFAALSLAGTATVLVVLAWRVRFATLAAYLAVALLVSAFFGPATWPWYLSWGLSLVAALPAAQRSRVLPVAICVLAVEVKPDGILALARSTAPLVLAFYVALGLVAWRHLRRQVRRDVRAVPASDGTALS